MGAPPPWLWLTLAIYLWHLPSRLAWWYSQLKDLTGHGAYNPETVRADGFVALRASMVIQAMPFLFILAGIVGVLLPQLRRNLVEGSQHLLHPDEVPPAPPAPPASPADPGPDGNPDGGEDSVRQMERFLSRHAPEVRLRVNTERADHLARVYPGGWRTTRIAVFPPFAKLWRGHRSAAEAALLHELGHHRHGDQHVSGIGSPFAALARHWLGFFALLGLLPLLLLFAVGDATADYQVAQVITVFTVLLQTLLIPVAALWTLELAADRYAAATAGRAVLLSSLEAVHTTRRVRRWRDRLAPLHHPPLRLRRWFAVRSGRFTADLALLLLWPASVLGTTAVATVMAVPEVHFLNRVPWGDSLHIALALGRGAISDSAPEWLAILALLLLWPLLAPLWPRLWGSRVEPPAVGALLAGYPVRLYAAAAVLPVAVLLAGLLPHGAATALVQPAGDGTASAPAVSPSCPEPHAPAPPRRPAVPGMPASASPAPTPDPAEVQAEVQARTFRTTVVVSATPLLGTKAQMHDVQDRLRHAVWTLGPDGSLVSTTGEGPLHLTGSREGVLLLSGESTLTTEVSATTTWWQAQLRPTADHHAQLTLTRAASQAMHAVVACREFDSASTVAARFVLDLS
ncbi:hypothetical protein [Peterkaempfera bronchialis]|uniref:hypothetical protein n=1 Tax=Peterkaempfera bronchialis TaxID=2126346 RepID=UPI003C2F2AF3